MKKIGSLTLGIRHYTELQALYSVIFMLRRLLFVAALVGLPEHPGLCVRGIIILNITAIGYFCTVQPHDSPIARRLEVVNESLLQIATYFLVGTELSTGVTYDDVIGNCLVGTIAILLIINIILVSV